jgi:tetratricopeptide (TPR) repeat protein
MRKPLIYLFFVVLVVAIFYKSPFSALLNYNKAKALYDTGKYEQAIPYFERSLFASPKGILARFYYVQDLAKAKPTYSVQKKLYKMSQSEIPDEATKMAKTKSVALRYKLLEGVENNYIYNALSGNDILRWDIKSFPLKVYLEKSSEVPEYYSHAIRTAFGQWESHTNFVKFTYVEDEKDANIVVKFKDLPSDVCSENGCKYTVAYTEPEIDKHKVLNRMRLSFYKTNPNNERFTNLEVFNTALHEIGHTLGIMGHSDNSSDIMYALLDSDKVNLLYYAVFHSLSKRDLNTLVLLYRLKPTITNTKDLSSESFYYAPLVIGSDDVILQKKLEETLQYLKDYPTLASSYINLASVYVDMGNFQEAQATLLQGENFARSQDEKFLFAYNKAIVYCNLSEYDKALEMAQQANSIKPEEKVQDLIESIQIIKTQNKK